MSAGEIGPGGGMSDKDLHQVLAAANKELLEHIETAADSDPTLTVVMSPIGWLTTVVIPRPGVIASHFAATHEHQHAAHADHHGATHAHHDADGYSDATDADHHEAPEI